VRRNAVYLSQITRIEIHFIFKLNLIISSGSGGETGICEKIKKSPQKVLSDVKFIPF
jgi:hypothetical protein